MSPILLRHGLTISHNLKIALPNLYWTADNLCFLPASQELISYEVFDDYHKKTIDLSSKSNLSVECDGDESRTSNNEEEEKTQTMREDNMRLELLEHYLLSKKVLFPTGLWKDCYRWKDNLCFTMWLRREFLLAKYYDKQKMQQLLNNYPQLTTESMKIKPPSDVVVKKAFGLENWNRKLDSIKAYARMKELASVYGGKVLKPLHGPIVDDDLDVSNITLEDALDILGYQVNDSNTFNIYCEEINMWPFWTREYINTLATYLLDRSSCCEEKETIILEIGAGDGRLSHFLRNEFTHSVQERKTVTKNIPKVIATDDGSWEINHVGPVEKLNAQQALSKYCADATNQQVIIICSWMPNGFDWTYLFRYYNVYEYILIGESDDGNCGHVWHTWGNPDYSYYNYWSREANDEDVEACAVMPPYQFDGYERIDLEYVSELQYARFDTCKSRCSNTISFRKL